jgi:protein SHQ1
MITPRFQVRQDTDFVVVTIRVRSVKVDAMEFYVLDHEFKFYCRPYFLRLNFPHALVEDGREGATYDPMLGEIVCTLPKAEPGQDFPNLGMLTALLARTKPPQGEVAGPRIEVVGGDEYGDDGEDAGADGEEWEWDQELPAAEEGGADATGGAGMGLLPSIRYGFNDAYSGYFRDLAAEAREIVDLPEPDTTPAAQRRGQRLAAEEQKFDGEYIVAEAMDQATVEQILRWTPHWQLATPAPSPARAAAAAPAPLVVTTTSEPQPEPEPETGVGGADIAFTEAENKVLLELPRKEYLLSGAEERSVWLGLLDLLLAYIYDHRTTMGDATVESGWTIATLAPTRNWRLVLQILADAQAICSSGSLPLAVRACPR